MNLHVRMILYQSGEGTVFNRICKTRFKYFEKGDFDLSDKP